MGTLRILATGVWPSVTGGWYYDTYLNRFSNTLHFYLWLFYLLLPLIFYVSLPLNYVYGTVYILLVGISLGLIKLLNYQLHVMLDGEGIQGDPPPEEQQQQQQEQANEVSVDNQLHAESSSNAQRQQSEEEQEQAIGASENQASENVAASASSGDSSTDDIPSAALINTSASTDGGLEASGTTTTQQHIANGSTDITPVDLACREQSRLASHRVSTDTQDTIMLDGPASDSVPRPSSHLALDVCAEQEEASSTAESSRGSSDMGERRPSQQQAGTGASTVAAMLAETSTGATHNSTLGSAAAAEPSSASAISDSGGAAVADLIAHSLNQDSSTEVEEAAAALAEAEAILAVLDGDIADADVPSSVAATSAAAPDLDGDAQLVEAPAVLASSMAREDSTTEDLSRHLAQSYNDTTDGAIHCYTDEDGQLHMYTFGAEGSSQVVVGPSMQRVFQESNFSETGQSSLTSAVIRRPPVPPPRTENPRPLGMSTTRVRGVEKIASTHSSVAAVTFEKPEQRVHPIPGFRKFSIPVQIDRLQLTRLLDRDQSASDGLISIFLAMASAALGYALLASSFYQDFSVFAMCFVLASAHYSLIKSVQPDPASSTQYDNHWTALSRSIYLIVIAAVILILDATSRSTQSAVLLYGINFHSASVLSLASRALQIFVLCFPAVFTLGLLPQFNIFVLYTLEQIDLHVFGGNGTSGLSAAIFVNIRTMIIFAICYGFAYGAGKAADPQTTPWLSAAVALLASLCYHLSRVSSNPSILWLLAKNCFKSVPDEPSDKLNPYPQQLQETVLARNMSDLVVCVVIAVVAFALHSTRLFQYQTVLWVLCCTAAFIGFFIHYLLPQLRKHQPWLAAVNPVLRAHEHNAFEVSTAAEVTWFEKALLYVSIGERLFLYPVLFISAVTVSAPQLFSKFDVAGGAAILCITGIRMVRGSFMDITLHYVIVSFAALFFQYDFKGSSETFLVDFFFSALIIRKSREFFQKMYFVLTYIAPWQQIWGSTVHVAAQPLSVPHSGMLLFQSILSSIFSTPLTPFVGSAIFLNSYVRPIKFWERDYSTRRVDNSNTRLSSQIDENPGNDDNNLNSIFYEHLTRSLRQSLCGDLSLGRWGQTYAGDFFLLASDSLNALVHVVEVGNGHVTFQLRGLEFKGTYCQQREVEAINEDITNGNCCCCHPGHPPGMLSVNLMFQQRWLAWEVKARRFVLEGYSITANGASAMLNGYDTRRTLLSYYVKSIIFYTLRSEKIFEWLEDETLNSSLYQVHQNSDFVELDSAFTARMDEDYDPIRGGVTQARFHQQYRQFLTHCAQQRSPSMDSRARSKLVTLCFALSLVGRRVLNTAANNDALSVNSFLYGLHAVFKGDMRIVSHKDEWVFTSMDMLHQIIKPAIRMALKLHQDHFLSTDEYDDCETLRLAIEDYHINMVIAHESDPAWRNAVLDNVPSLLALRHVMDEATMNFKIIMLNKRHLSFRVIKVNEECVRGLWAGQQYELIFLRNSNAERGSIQNARQALRNIINSSCDIGYPIYVSPLTTSYAESNNQITDMLGPSLSWSYLWSKLGQCLQFARCRLTGSHNQPSSTGSTTAAAAAAAGPASGNTSQGLPTRRVGFGGATSSFTTSAGPRSPLMPGSFTSASSTTFGAGAGGGGAGMASGVGDHAHSPPSSSSPPQLPREHAHATASTSGGHADPSQAGSSMGMPWSTASMGGGEEGGSTASVGFRLAHGSTDSLQGLSSAITDRESHVSSFRGDGRKSSSTGARDSIRHVNINAAAAASGSAAASATAASGVGTDEMTSMEGMSICGSSMAGISTVSQLANAGSLALSAHGANASVGDSTSHIHMDSVSRGDVSSRADTHSRLDGQSVAETTSRSDVYRRRAGSRSGSLHSTAGMSVAASSDLVVAGSLATMDAAATATDGVSLSNTSNLDASSRMDGLESASRVQGGSSLAGSGSLRSDRWSTAVSDNMLAGGSIAGGYSGAGDSLAGVAGSIGVPDAASTHATTRSIAENSAGSVSVASLDQPAASTPASQARAGHAAAAAATPAPSMLASVVPVGSHGGAAAASATTAATPNVSSTAVDMVDRAYRPSVTSSNSSSIVLVSPSQFQHQFRILRVELIFKHISDSEPPGLDIRWPDEDMRIHCSPTYWQSKNWWPAKGVIGRLVHVWLPTKDSNAAPERYHKLPGFGAIMVLQCDDDLCCVAIDQTAVADLGALC
eukprot:scpid4339/ scgid0624/ Pecanex-like protein 1; Pecanex homolog